MFRFDALNYPDRSRRTVVYAREGMIASTQPLASQAGLEILKKGGNAVDAAVASAAALTVLEPNSNSIGGDAFSLLWNGGKLHGLNASGPAPSKISLDKLSRRGFSSMPRFGWMPVTVPGLPAAWAELSSRFGSLPFEELFKPAVNYAENGFPVSPVISKFWKVFYDKYASQLKGEEFEEWFKTFAPDGRAPYPGEIIKMPDHANTLKLIARTKSESFYRGELAEKIDQFSRRYGGFLTGDDLAGYEPQWVSPIRVNYRGYDIWELPPNGQGLITLIALSILKDFDFTAQDITAYHRQIEALKLAFVDGLNYITDYEHLPVKVEKYLSEDYIQKRRAEMTDRALMPRNEDPEGSETVYLACADGEGNMISYIQSHFQNFGSGLVVPGTGIVLQNRGLSFSTCKEHPNSLEGGKKSYHTIIPGFITEGGLPLGPFGVMGSYMQPQGHLQVLMNMIDFNLNPQAALDAPRWRWTGDKNIVIEKDFNKKIARSLSHRGHNVNVDLDESNFGRGQIILKDRQSGVLIGGTEPRADSQIAVW